MSHKCLLMLLGLLLTAPAFAQERNPVLPYRPDELVSFKRDVPMQTALQILSSFAQRFEGKIIIDRKTRTKAIGVDVENMQWKRALEYILRSNMLQYKEQEQYIEIEELTSAPAEAENIITANTREIEINAIFFQADYNSVHELGIDWSTFKNGTVDVRAFGATNVTQEFFRVSGEKTFKGRVRVSALLRAFESRGRGEIIARPHIKVMEGEQGKIKVGKNFFLTVQDFAGNTRFSEYESGIILTVTPTILGHDDSTFIHLVLQAERSDVKQDVVGVTKDITESQTRVLLLDGEETVIAGLISQENEEVRKGIPILKDLPWWFFGLRYLFGYESSKREKKELVVFIRARLVPQLFTRRVGRINPRAYLDYNQQDLKRFYEVRSPDGSSRSVKHQRE